MFFVIMSQHTFFSKSVCRSLSTQVVEMLEQSDAIGPELELRCQRHGNHTRVHSSDPGRLATAAGDGGCELPCGMQMPCMHVCSRWVGATCPGWWRGGEVHSRGPRHGACLCSGSGSEMGSVQIRSDDRAGWLGPA